MLTRIVTRTHTPVEDRREAHNRASISRILSDIEEKLLEAVGKQEFGRLSFEVLTTPNGVDEYSATAGKRERFR